MILSIFRHFNSIKIVMHLEVTPQNVKQPRTGRNSGHVRNSDKYDTELVWPRTFIVRSWCNSVEWLYGVGLSTVLYCTVLYCTMCVPSTTWTGGKPQRHRDKTTRGGIQERTVGLRFLGIILRVLRLEVSTLVLCLSTRCSSRTDLSFLHWLIVLYGFLKP